MASLMDLVSQNQPHFQTHQALLIVGLQNDFVTPEGRLPVDTKTGFLERIQTLIPKFRELSGNVIWVQTLYEGDRIATGADTGEGDTLVVGGLFDGDESNNEAADEELAKEAAALPAQSRSSKHKQRALDLLKRVSASRKKLPKEVAKAKAEEDEELFLLKSEKRTPACVPDTHGADFADAIANEVELATDVVVRTTNYSAFQGTNLLMTLRARLITELFIVGCITNVSVLATVIDAARHGVKIHVVEDCLGFRKESRHELALKRMEDFFSAFLVNSEEILKDEQLKAPVPTNGAKSGEKGSDQNVEELMSKMSLASTIIANRTAARAAEESATGTKKQPTDKEFSDMLAKGAAVPNAQEEEKKPELVKTKIRMRTGKARKKKKAKEGEEPKGGGGAAESKPDPSTDQPKKESPPPTITSPAVVPPPISTDSQRTSKIAKAGSVADLREKDMKQHVLKNATSVPMLSTKADGGEKEKNKLSDFSDRVRMSLSRAPKSDSGSESKRGSVSSAKAASTTSKQDDKQPTLTATPSDQPTATTQETDSSVKTTTMSKSSKLQSLATFPVLGPGDHIAERDSRIIHDFFPVDLVHPSAPSKPLKDVIFTQLYNEVRWQKMLHQQGEVPRLVCCQGAFGDDGSMPIYRHPADQTLPLLRFSPKVQVIGKQAEKLVGHPLNHVLIQLYRSGNDFISEHSDKTLDIVKGSSIVNVSFGSQRTMRLRTKKSQAKPEEDVDSTTQRETQRVALPHNSMFVLGLASNAKWLHGIQPDKRLSSERSASETAYNGIRISLTFRHIGTFLDARETIIWGQGATAKTPRDAADIISNDDSESTRLIKAFSRENHDPDFDWEQHYGDGFDVLHLHVPPPADVPLLFLSSNTIENQQVMICLAEMKIPYTVIEASIPDPAFEVDRQVTFRDTDLMHTQIDTASSILSYLDRYYPLDTSPSSHLMTSNGYLTMLVAASAMKAWLNRAVPGSAVDLKNLVRSLEEIVEGNGGPFVAGSRFSIADTFVWPVVHVLVGEWEEWDDEEFVKLGEWYRACWRKKASLKKVVDALAVPKGKGEDGGKA
jgi:nicotinamidase-related amidase/alkylated DNA repair dioxygenase AlkB